jgi:hypothetical protein
MSGAFPSRLGVYLGSPRSAASRAQSGWWSATVHLTRRARGTPATDRTFWSLSYQISSLRSARCSGVTVLSMNIDEWGNAVTSAVSFICLIAAVLTFFNGKRRIAIYLAVSFYILFFPIRLWFFQFELTERGSIGVTYIVEVVVVQLFLGGIVPLVVSCFFRFRPVVTGLLLAYVFSLLLQFFSYVYWTYGTTQNFNIELSHLDSFYFAVGTLTTAGTGNISAISDTSRGYQTVQMALGLALVGFVVVLIMARYVNLLSNRPHITAAEEISMMQELVKRVPVTATNAQEKGAVERRDGSGARRLARWAPTILQVLVALLLVVFSRWARAHQASWIHSLAVGHPPDSGLRAAVKVERTTR